MHAPSASLFNLTGLAVVFGASLLMLRNYASAFFGQWTRAFSLAFAMTAVEAVATELGRPPAVQLFEVALCLSASWYYFQTSAAIRDQRLPWRYYWLALPIGLALALGLVLQGYNFTVVSAPPLLLLSLSIAYLGFVLVRRGRMGQDGFSATWLGVPLLMLGCLPLVFPLIVDTPLMWMGYWAAGLLNLVTGIGMVMFVLEGTTERLRQQNKALMVLDQMKTDFLSLISHELRTPLTVIKGGVALVRESRLSEHDSQKIMSSVAQHADQLHRLIDDLLDFSRMELGKLSYHKQPCDLAALTRCAGNDFRRLCDQKDITFVSEIGPEPFIVWIDEGRVNQVLMNLLSNALKFTPAGGRITLTLRQEGTSAVVTVADTGPGLSLPDQVHIFQRFYQVEHGDTRRVDGVGLGLAICKSIVETGHSGRLWVESQLSVGSSFSFALPIDGGVVPRPTHVDPLDPLLFIRKEVEDGLPDPHRG